MTAENSESIGMRKNLDEKFWKYTICVENKHSSLPA
jgi:hypothetical protein